MKRRYRVPLLLSLALLSCSIAAAQDSKTSTTAPRASLPDNPCDLLSPSQIAEATGLQIISTARVPSIAKIVEAQRNHREPDPGTICSYETRSGFGAIMIAVPIRSSRRTAEYWKARAKYFDTYPGSAKAISDLGMDAWLGGGSMLRVLAGEDAYFTVSTQMYKPRSEELLVKIARLVLGQL